MSARWRGVALAVVGLAAFGCELAEVTIAEPEKTVVAEAYVEVGLKQLVGVGGLPPSPYNRIAVFLHETLDASGKSGPVSGARIRVTRPSDGLAINLHENLFFGDSTGDNLSNCIFSRPPRSSGTCYDVSGDPNLETLAAGDTLALRIDLADGRVLTSETVVPGRFDLHGATDGGSCIVKPNAGTGLRWSASSGAWAYVADTYVSGLGRVFPHAEVEPLYLFGLSVSAADTAIVFPREFGVFARGSLDHDVATALQVGLPDTTAAVVSVTAVDRNWVNWARGGNFNPSGMVRVPSIRGDGTGVFGSGVVRQLSVVSTTRSTTVPPCPPEVDGP